MASEAVSGDETEQLRVKLAEVTERFNELRGRVANAWLTKDFNVLYVTTRNLLRAMATGDTTTIAARFDEATLQIERLVPAFAETEHLKGLLNARAVLIEAIQAADAETWIAR